MASDCGVYVAGPGVLPDSWLFKHLKARRPDGHMRNDVYIADASQLSATWMNGSLFGVFDDVGDLVETLAVCDVVTIGVSTEYATSRVRPRGRATVYAYTDGPVLGGDTPPGSDDY